MFMTDSRRSMTPVPGTVFKGEVQVWSSVEVGIHMPLFHAAFKVIDRGGERTRCLITPSLHDLDPSGLIECDGAVLESITLMSPPWLNGTKNWRMDALSEVRECNDDSVEGTGVYFVLCDGTVLMDEPLSIEARNDSKSVFFFTPPESIETTRHFSRIACEATSRSN
ncbi:MAG: hypothetical protein V4650_16285 [Pseudomonadota bacterium]